MDNGFVQDLLLGTPQTVLMAAMLSGDYSAIGLALKADSRAVLNAHIDTLHRNIALQMRRK